MKLNDDFGDKKDGLNDEDYNLVSYIFSSEIRLKIIISLFDGLIFPKSIKEHTDINYSVLSRYLKDLEQMGIVKCQNPKAKKGRIYEPTEKSFKLKDQIIRINNDINNVPKI